MFKHVLWYGCIFVLCFSAGSCTRLSGVDRAVCEPVNTLRWVDFNALDLESLPVWVEMQYSVPEADLLEFEHRDGILEVQWRYMGRVYAAFFEGRSLRSLGIRPVSNDIRAYQVIECFGVPGFYGAYVVSSGEQKRYDVHFWYPDEGIVARYSFVSTTGGSRPSVNEHSSVDVIVFKPDVLDEVVVEAYIPGVKFLPSGWSQYIKPWPGSWEKMEFTELSW